MEITRHVNPPLKSLLAVFQRFLRGNGASKEQETSAQKVCLYLNAASFDPHRSCEDDRCVIILARNHAETISARVREELRATRAVVVIDQGSTDATPHLAAEAGAIVVLQSKPIDRQDGLRKAVKVAHRFSDNISVIDLN